MRTKSEAEAAEQPGGFITELNLDQAISIKESNFTSNQSGSSCSDS